MSTTSPISQVSLNPFPGLRAFKGSESDLFFGREEHVQDVLQKLEQNHFVAVVGTSGTGKSSLIKAGVLPSIAKEHSSTGQVSWTVVSTNPGSAPLQNMADALANAPTLNKDSDPKFAARLTETIANNSLGLVQAMRPLIRDGERLLILVDQFEEVFRFSDETSEKRKEYDEFVRLLIDTVRQKDVSVYVILTLRSDFLGDCVSFEGLPEAINDGHYLVPRMNQAQLKRAITGPIEHASGKISPRLIQVITHSLGNNPDQLPILQHAMMRCWDFWGKHELEGVPMDVNHFESIGGLDQALSKHANEAFAELNSEQKTLIEKVFKALTVKTDESRGVRRPMPLHQLCAVTKGSQAEVLACLNPFRAHGRSFILPEANVAVNSDTVFDISHESLMRGWDRLKIWVDEEMESAELYQRICHAAVLHKQGAVALWRDPELQLAVDWNKKQNPIKAWAVLYNADFDAGMQFIDDSVASNYADKKRIKRRRAIIRLSLTVIVLIISALAVWGFIQTNLANEKTTEAESKTQESLKQKALAEEAKESALLASKNAITAKEAAEEQTAIAEKQKSIAEEQKAIAETQKQLAKSSRDVAIKEREIANSQRNVANNKSLEALIAKQRADSLRISATRLRLLALSDKLAYESEQAEPELAAVLAIQSFNLANLNGGETNDASHYQAASEAIKSINSKYSSKVTTTESLGLAMEIKDGRINMIDANGNLNAMRTNGNRFSATTSLKVSTDKINSAYLSNNANRLLIGLESNLALTKVINDTAKFDRLRRHTGLVRTVLFRPVATELVTGGRDGHLIYWEDGKIRFNKELPARIKSISGNETANFCYAGCENGGVYKVNLAKGDTQSFSMARNTRVEVVNQTADGAVVFVGYSNGNVGIFNATGEKFKELSSIGIISFIKVDATNDLLVIGTSSRLIAIYSLESITGRSNTFEQLDDSGVFLETVTASDRPATIKLTKSIRSLNIDSNTGDIFAYCSDQTLHRFPSKTRDIINELENHVSRKLTQEEWNSYMGTDIPFGQLTPSNTDPGK